MKILLIFILLAALSFNSFSVDHYVAVGGGGTGTTYRLSFDEKIGTMTNVYYSIYDQTHSVDIIPPTSYYASTSSTVQRVSFPFTAPAGCTQVRVFPLRNSTTGTIFIGRAQVESNGSAYVTTTTLIIP